MDEGLAVLGVEGRELVCREGDDTTGPFKVVGEEVSIMVYVGFRGGRGVGPCRGARGRGGNQALPWSGLRDTKPKQGEQKGVRGIVHLVTWCCIM